MNTSVKNRQMSESFFLGAILAVTGGFLDAYTYLCRGKVFANAQTGNMVLMGINLAEGNWRNVFRYLLPISAFIFGVLIAETIRHRFKENGDINIHWRQIVIAVELLVLLVVGFLPAGHWDSVANIAVSFVCSLQVEAFRKVRGYPYATTMCTGNLRSATEQLFLYRRTRQRASRDASLQYYGIILLFIGGAVLGVFLTKLFSVGAVFVCCGLLAAAFVVMFVREEESGKKKV